MIQKVLNKIKDYIEGEASSYDFSIELEDLLFSNYEEMKKENCEITEFLNEDLPDICASYDEENETEFRKQIKQQYKTVLKMYSK